MQGLRCVLPWLGLAAWIALTLAVRCGNRDNVLVEGQVYFVDADCYSRMTRVERVMREPWKPIRFHDFENAPSGTTPHTTAPMDLLLAALAWIFDFRFSIFDSWNSLDLAGAFVSPLLAVVLAAFLWRWGRGDPFRPAMLFVVALSPILVHGFALGRPDHQSLIVTLAGVALAAELSLWRGADRRWHLVSAAAWALALWTSLYEPLILLAAVILLRLFVLGKNSAPGWKAFAIFAAILTAGFAFDGWRVQALSAETAPYFSRWAHSIGELHAASPAQIFAWTGWLLAAVPLLLGWRFWKMRDRAALAQAALVLLLAGLCLWHARWGYFLALAFALALPSALAAIPWRAAAWTAFVIALWPMAAEWEGRLFPDEAARAALAENREDALLLRQASTALVAPEPEIILAPWWLSPAVAYWSGQPCVAGSSHQSLPGTIDTARFYLATDPREAAAILRDRRVAYVVAYETSRVVLNSSQILGRTPVGTPLAAILYDVPERAPAFLRLVFQNKYFKVYEVNREIREIRENE